MPIKVNRKTGNKGKVSDRKKEKQREEDLAVHLKQKAKDKVKKGDTERSGRDDKYDKPEKSSKSDKSERTDKAVKESEEQNEKVPKRGLKKFGKSIAKLGNPKTPTEKLMSLAQVVGFHIYEIACEIVSRDKFGITVRYKKGKSRSIRRDTFSYDDVVAIARHGDKSVVYVRSNRAFISERGTVKRNAETGWYECTTTFGETFELNPYSKTGVDVQIITSEDEDFVGGGKQKNSKRSIEEQDDNDLEEDEGDEGDAPDK